MEPGPTGERRASPRYRTLKRGLIVPIDGRRTISCMLVDLSQDGAQLSDCDVFSCPSEFALQLHDNRSLDCRVVRWTRTAIGVRFS
jgi:hypothetical protein